MLRYLQEDAQEGITYAHGQPSSGQCLHPLSTHSPLHKVMEVLLRLKRPVPEWDQETSWAFLCLDAQA